MRDDPREKESLEETASISASAEVTLEASTVAAVTAAASETGEEIPLGTAIGRYLVGARIGEGGMGVVYSGHDPELDRGVALKLVKIGAGKDAEWHSRLLREAKAMAQLSHPNVVVVYDAGLWRERVFLAMELVHRATTLKEWQIEAPRPWREILRVYLEAGRGIAAAHAAGIVHRDVKPDNILVDGAGRIRVTDFGIARAQGDPAESSSADVANLIGDDPLTRPGRVVGTPAYMAPEVLFGAVADARSDQFGFCVALYRALYGERPYPSNRIQPGPDVRVSDPSRRTPVPPHVRRVLLRGLSVRPEERYPAMEALLEDLARDPVRRRRDLFAAAGVVSLVAVLAVAALSSRRATTGGLCGEADPLAGAWDQKARAEVQDAFAATGPAGAAAWPRTRTVMDAAAGEWRAALKATCDVGGTRTVPAATAPVEARLLRTTCLERQRDQLRALVGVLRDADADVVAHASSAAAALPGPGECDSVRVLSLASRQPESPSAQHDVAALRLRLARATALAVAGKVGEARTLLEAIVVGAIATGYRPVEAEAHFALGVLLDDAGEVAAAGPPLTRAVLAAEAAGEDRIATRAAARLAYQSGYAGRLDEADAWLARADAVVERMGGDARAESDVAFSKASIAYLRVKNEESLREGRRSRELRRKLLGEAHPDTLRALNTVAIALTVLGRHDEALSAYRETVAIFDESHGPEHPGVARPLVSEAHLLIHLGRLEEAEGVLRRVVPLSESLRRTTVPKAGAHLGLAALRLEQGRFEEAIAAARTTQETALATTGPNSGNFQAGLLMEARARLSRREFTEAIALLSTAAAIDDKAGSPADRDDEVVSLLVEALLKAGRTRDALARLDQVKHDSAATRFPDSYELARAHFSLARALPVSSTRRARELAVEAHALIAPQPWRSREIEEIDRWLAQGTGTE